jgi:hypothetical protein
LRRRIFIGDRDEVGHRPAQADSGQQAIDKQLVHRRDPRRQQREQAKDRRADQDYPPAPEPVRQWAEQKGADGQTEKAGAEDGPESGFLDAPVLGDARRDIGDRLGVEAVERGDQRAQERDPELEQAERRGVDGRLAGRRRICSGKPLLLGGDHHCRFSSGPFFMAEGATFIAAFQPAKLTAMAPASSQAGYHTG